MTAYLAELTGLARPRPQKAGPFGIFPNGNQGGGIGIELTAELAEKIKRN